jgi:hypothetical protein
MAMGKASALFVLLLVYLVLLLGCLRMAALLIDMHDDVAFVLGFVTYVSLAPLTTACGWAAFKILKP